MEKADLTKVKYVGASRMKSLKDLGITTIEQLHKTPLDKLAQIPTIGRYYAKLIKDAVSRSYGEKPQKTVPKVAPDKAKKIGTFKENLINQITSLKKGLERIDEEFKPPEKKKILEIYNDFKKKSKTLMKRLDGLNQIQGNISKKVSKSIAKKTDILNAQLKNMGTKIKKKKVQKLSLEIESFSKRLKKLI